MARESHSAQFCLRRLNRQSAAGWKTKPTSYLISAQDQAINPDTQRFMANRMGGTVETIQASHVAFISRPVEVAAFIMAALP